MSLKDFFHKREDGIVILKETKPGMCGGTDATQDTNAPKQIHSDDMMVFSATSVLNNRSDDGCPGYVSAFAVPASGGTFLFLQTGKSLGRREEKRTAFCVVRENTFPALADLVRELDLARNNGYHSKTHGLPENFGGEVNIRYSSGERISYSNNQSPVLSAKEGAEIAKLFEKAMSGETVLFPCPESLTAIRFEENHNNGGFTKVSLTVHPDGTGENRKQSRYGDGKVYESIQPLNKENVDSIKKNMSDTGILMWSGLPDQPYMPKEDRKMTFVFADGTEIPVRDGRWVPDQLRHGFFDIQLEITVKH